MVDDFHEIGVNVLNISQPNVMDLAPFGRRFRGRQCFLVPISYQTVSIRGTVEEIYAEARRLCDLLAAGRRPDRLRRGVRLHGHVAAELPLREAFRRLSTPTETIARRM